jgi:hypothetical protein
MYVFVVLVSRCYGTELVDGDRNRLSLSRLDSQAYAHRSRNSGLSNKKDKQVCFLRCKIRQWHKVDLPLRSIRKEGSDNVSQLPSLVSQICRETVRS